MHVCWKNPLGWALGCAMLLTGCLEPGYTSKRAVSKSACARDGGVWDAAGCLLTPDAVSEVVLLSTAATSSNLSNDTRPSLRISGIKAGNTISAYDSSSCDPSNLRGTAVAGAGTVDLVLDTLPTDGAYVFYFKQSDSRGRASACSDLGLPFTLDTTAPSLVASGGGALADDATPANSKSWSWLCAGAEGCAYRFAIDQSASWSATGTYGATVTASQPSGDGTYYLHVQARDNAGNESAVVTISAVLDNTAPVITGLVDDPAPTSSKTWSWACSGGPCTYRFAVDQSVSWSATGPYGSTATASQTSGDGTYYLHVQAKDNAGNESAVVTVSAVLDNSGPAITGLVDDTTATQSKTWSWACTGGPCTYRFAVDQSASWSAAGTYGSTATASQASGDGTYYLHVQAKDNAGNESAVVTVSAVLDNTTPVITGLADDATPTQSKSWSWACTGGPCTYLAVVNQSPSWLAIGTYGATASASQTSGDGTYYLHVLAQDSAGNTSTPVTVSAVLDNTAPAAPSGLALAPGTNSISNSTAPVIRVSGVSGGDTVTLHTENTCGLASQRASGVATGTTIDLTSSGLSTETTYGFYAKSTDAVGNVSGCSSTSVDYTLDTTAPTLQITGPIPIAGGLLTALAYTVTYSGASNITLSAADITLGGTDAAGCTPLVSGVGSTYTVSIENCSGNGAVNISVAAGTASDSAGNLAAASGPSPDGVVDNIAPTLAISGPTPSIGKSTTTFAYTVTYTDASMINLTATKVTLSGTTAGCTKSVTGTGSTTRTVNVTGCTGNGTVAVSIAANSASDAAGNVASSAGPSAAFTVDNVAPTVALSTPSPTSGRSGSTFVYTATYSGASNITLSTADVTLGGTATAGCTKSVGGTGSTSRTISVTGCTGNGTLNITLASGSATDAAGNLAAASATSSNATVDNTPPTLSISAPSPSTGKSTSTFAFAVTYGGASTVTLADTDVTLGGTATAGCTKSVSGTGSTTRTVSITGCTGDGTLNISLASGTATDAAGNSAAASSVSANATVDNTGPTLSISNPTPTNGGASDTFAFSITYAGASTITLAAADVTLGGTATSGCVKSVSGTGSTTRTVSVIGCSGIGTLNVSVASNTATDAAGNLASSGGPSPDAAVDNPPRIIPSGTLTLNADASATRTLRAEGGVGPYTFEKIQGEGSVNASTGVFTPSSRRGTTIVRVADSRNQTTQVTLSQIASRFNGTVAAMAMDGSGYGYFGGQFTTYNPIHAPGFLALDTTSGGLKTGTCDFAGLFGTGSIVRAIAEITDSLFIGGSLTSYAGSTVQNLVKVNKSSCALDTIFTQSTGPNSDVYSLVVSGNAVYVGGQFTTYRGSNAKYLAKVDTSTGALDTTFTQSTGPNNSILSLAVSGTSLYAGGSFTTYRGTAANRLAKLDLNTGTLDTTFTQSTGMDAEVYALAASGTALYAGGVFTTYRSSTAQRLAKLDLASGAMDATFTQATGMNNGVYSMAVAGSALYVGGDFDAYRGSAAQRLAKLDLTTGNLDTTFTQSSGFYGYVRVSALSVAGTALYAGGSFTNYRNTTANSLAKIDLTSGALDTTFTATRGMNSYGYVFALVGSGTTVYAGGNFGTYRGSVANYLAKVDLTTGALDTTFTQATGLDGYARALLLSGTSLYVGGSFSTYRGASANYLAKIATSDGALDTTFTQSSGFDGTVYALLESGTSLYVGGSFSTYRGATAQRLAKVALSNGALATAFSNPTSVTDANSKGFTDPLYWNPTVYALATSGTSLYVGGHFTYYRGVVANNIAKIALSDGALDSAYMSGTGLDNDVYALLVSGTSLWAGGKFYPVVAKLSLDTGASQGGPSFYSNSIGLAAYSLAISGGAVYVGGNLTNYNGVALQRLAKLDANDGTLDTSFTQSTGFDSNVRSMMVSGSSLYVGGDFTTYRGSTAPNLTLVDLLSGALAD